MTKPLKTSLGQRLRETLIQKLGGVPYDQFASVDHARQIAEAKVSDGWLYGDDYAAGDNTLCTICHKPMGKERHEEGGDVAHMECSSCGCSEALVAEEIRRRMTRAQTASEYAEHVVAWCYERADDFAERYGEGEAVSYRAMASHFRREIRALRAAEKQQRAEAIERVRELMRNDDSMPYLDQSAAVAIVNACFGREGEE